MLYEIFRAVLGIATTALGVWFGAEVLGPWFVKKMRRF